MILVVKLRLATWNSDDIRQAITMFASFPTISRGTFMAGPASVSDDRSEIRPLGTLETPFQYQLKRTMWKSFRKLLIAVVFLSSTFSANAQELGIRFGDVLGNSVAVDGLFQVGEFSRVHADLSFGNGVGIEALYDFLYKPLGADGFNWYVGAGPSMLIDDPFYLGFSGELGLDYHFDAVPVSLSLDWRPTFWLIEKTSFRAEGFGLNVRYVFGR